MRIETGRTTEGKRKFRYETVKGNEEAAQRRRFELLDANDKGTLATPEKVTLADFFDRWRKGRQALGKLSRSSSENYQIVFQAYVAPTLGGMRVQRVKGTDIQTLYTTLLTEPRESGKMLTPATVLHVHRILSPLFKAARKSRIVAINIMEEVEPPSRPKARPKALDTAGVTKLLAAIAGDWKEPIALVALAAGIRRGELCGLRWRDVDLDGARLHVRGQLVQYKDGTLEWKTPKTENGVRTIALPGETVDMLRRLRVEAGRQRMALGLGGGLDDAWVFTRDAANPIRPSRLTESFTTLCDEAGIPDFTFHGTRHTHITALLKEVGKAGAAAVAKRAGHSDIRTTLGVYTRVFESDDRELGDAASRIIGVQNVPRKPISER